MDKKSIGILSAAGENADFLYRVQAACDQAQENLIKRVAETGNMPIDKAQGFFAEAWHAETFNVDSVLKRMKNVSAEIMRSNSKNSVDIAVKENGKNVGNYSSKYYKSAQDSINAQKGYGEQSRLIPKDQLDEAKERISRQIQKDRASGRESRIANAEELESINEELTDRVKHNKVESQPLGRKESEQQTEAIRKGKDPVIQPQINTQKIIEESLRSGAIAAGITLSMTIAPRVYNDIVFRFQKGEWPKDSIKRILQGTKNSTVESGLRAAIATSITMSAKGGLLGETMRRIDPTTIGTLTFIAFEGAKDFTSYTNGYITGEELADSMMRKSLAATAGAYSAVIGQSIIPVPVVGAMIGAMIGSIIAQQGYHFMETLSEAYFRSTEFEQMKQVNVLISIEWDQFLNNYEDWIMKKHQYQEQKRSLERRYDHYDSINKALNDRLLNALKEGTDEF